MTLPRLFPVCAIRGRFNELHIHLMRDTIMKTRKTVIAAICSVGVLGAVTGMPAMASNDEMLPEERRGAVIGGIIGAVAGGPIGAGAGAIIGGGLFGNLFALDRIKGELETDLATAKAEHRNDQHRLEKRIAVLTSALDDARAEVGAAPRLPIQFRTASSTLESHYEHELEEVARMIRERPESRVTLAGFADRRGDEGYNMTLSQKRVEAVKQFLLKHGVARSQITTEAFGESRPVAAEPTPENHFFDRRVVMEVSVDKTGEGLPLVSR